MAKSTPGPWVVGIAHSYKNNEIVSTEYFVRLPGDDVAIAADIINPITSQADKVAEANAKLIASAPELLEALEGIAGACQNVAGGMSTDYLYGYLVGIRQVAERAIKRAT